MATGAVEVLLPLGLIGFGANAAWGAPWACLLVGGLLWLRYMADVVRRS